MAYLLPPEGYEPPTHCETCKQIIIYIPVIGGRTWSHLLKADHEVVMREEGWWDTKGGIWRKGIFDSDLEKALQDASKS